MHVAHFLVSRLSRLSPISLASSFGSGKNVLGQKSELKKAMEKRLDNQKKKQLEKERVDRRNSFERKLEEQANKLRISDEETGKKNTSNNPQCNNSPTPEADIPEFLKIHAKLHAAHDNKNANKPLVLDNAQRT